MAAIEYTRSQQATATNGRIGQIFQAAVASFKTWNDARKTRNALMQLSARELEDIGLCRGDIELIGDNRR